MSFRRIPFQFSATDPVKRHEELQKRFGFFKGKKDMRVDLKNRDVTNDCDSSPNSASSSPKSQHRHLEFCEDLEESHNSTKKSVEMPGERKPKVRVIPIEVEGADCAPKRHRNWPKQYQTLEKLVPSSKLFQQGIAPKSPLKLLQESRSQDIPIKVEKQVEKNDLIPPKEKQPGLPENSIPKKDSQSLLDNIPNTCQSSQEPKIKPKNLNVQLNKIETILQKLEVYLAEVECFKGSNKDKQYRYLDEMLTRCLLELDNIETMGKEDIRLSRKAAIKKVQYCTNLLEAKVDNLPTVIVENSNTSVDSFKTSKATDVFNNDNISKTNELCTISSETDEKKVQSEEDTVAKICESSLKQDAINIQKEPIKTLGCNIEFDSISNTCDAISNYSSCVENSVIEIVPTELHDKHSSEPTMTEAMCKKSDTLYSKNCNVTLNSSNTTESIQKLVTDTDSL